MLLSLYLAFHVSIDVDMAEILVWWSNGQGEQFLHYNYIDAYDK